MDYSMLALCLISTNIDFEYNKNVNGADSSDEDLFWDTMPHNIDYLLEGMRSRTTQQHKQARAIMQFTGITSNSSLQKLSKASQKHQHNRSRSIKSTV